MSYTQQCQYVASFLFDCYCFPITLVFVYPLIHSTFIISCFPSFFVTAFIISVIYRFLPLFFSPPLSFFIGFCFFFCFISPSVFALHVSLFLSFSLFFSLSFFRELYLTNHCVLVTDMLFL